MQIVVDKSFLLGAPRMQLAAILRDHEAIMPDVLFYEMLKDDDFRQRMFARLPQQETPLVLIQGTGEILRHEIERRRSVTESMHELVADQWRFHPELANGRFVLEPWMKASIAAQLDEYRASARGIADVAGILPSFLPELRQLRPGNRRFDPVLRRVRLDFGRDTNLMRRLYAALRHPDWPRPARIHRKTALFRLVQLRALGALSVLARYGPNPPQAVVAGPIEHDARDFDYALVATLCGAVATRDRGLAELVKWAEPTAVVIGLGPTVAIPGRVTGDWLNLARRPSRSDQEVRSALPVKP